MIGLVTADTGGSLVFQEIRLDHPGRCPICGDPVGEVPTRCPDCEAPHHADCYAWFGDCGIFGCGTSLALPPEAAVPGSGGLVLASPEEGLDHDAGGLALLPEDGPLVPGFRDAGRRICLGLVHNAPVMVGYAAACSIAFVLPELRAFGVTLGAGTVFLGSSLRVLWDYIDRAC